VYLGEPYAFLMKFSYLSKKKIRRERKEGGRGTGEASSFVVKLRNNH
jgi:hypothetical protein